MPRARNPIPPERARLETRLVAVMLRADGDRDRGPLLTFLHSFQWNEHPTLACIGLDHLAKRTSWRSQVQVADKVASFCNRNESECCDRCALHHVREARRGDD